MQVGDLIKVTAVKAEDLRAQYPYDEDKPIIKYALQRHKIVRIDERGRYWLKRPKYIRKLGFAEDWYLMPDEVIAIRKKPRPCHCKWHGCKKRKSTHK